VAVGKRSSKRPLQEVLGKGVNVNADNPLEVHDAKVGSLISYEGITTADGAADGSTLIDNVLTTKPDYNGNEVIITSGAYAGQASDINGVTTGGTVTAHTAFDGQILRGTKFVIAAIRLTPAEVAALTALVVLLMADVGDPTGETLGSLAAKWGDLARSLDLILGARWDGAGDLGTDIAQLLTYTDILDDATNGLANIKTLIDAVEVKLDTGGLGKGLVTKALTFANNNGQVPLFTVTGDVIVRIVAVVKTNCGSTGGCNVSVGIAADVDAIIPVTDITLLAAQEIWHDATPDSEIEALGAMREHIVSDGNDVTLNSSAADNSGAITFYCFWTALSSGATVVAA